MACLRGWRAGAHRHDRHAPLRRLGGTRGDGDPDGRQHRQRVHAARLKSSTRTTPARCSWPALRRDSARCSARRSPGRSLRLEVLAIGRMSYESVFPCLIASIVGDWTCTAWGIQHADYHFPGLMVSSIGMIPHLNWLLLVKTAVAAVAFGLASVLFAELAHAIEPWLQVGDPGPICGGHWSLACDWQPGVSAGLRDYLGLGVHSPDPHAVTIFVELPARRGSTPGAGGGKFCSPPSRSPPGFQRW